MGSLRKDSYNRFALQAAQELVPERHPERDRIARDSGLQSGCRDGLADSVVEFKRRIQAADAILFATPVQHNSLPGALNAIDWASRPYGESVWLGKPAAVMGASIGDLGTTAAQYHLRQILIGLNMPVVNQFEVMISNATQRFDEDGRLIDVPTRQSIRKLLDALIHLFRITRTAQSRPPDEKIKSVAH